MITLQAVGKVALAVFLLATPALGDPLDGAVRACLATKKARIYNDTRAIAAAQHTVNQQIEISTRENHGVPPWWKKSILAATSKDASISCVDVMEANIRFLQDENATHAEALRRSLARLDQLIAAHQKKASECERHLRDLDEGIAKFNDASLRASRVQLVQACASAYALIRQAQEVRNNTAATLQAGDRLLVESQKETPVRYPLQTLDLSTESR